jgi:hypothetical protein
MRDFIGAPNRPFVTEYRKERFKQAIDQRRCVVLENIPTDTTMIEIVYLINTAKLDVVDVFIPFNLVTQRQLNKAYVILMDRYAPYMLTCNIKNKIIGENTFRIILRKKYITF